jgi:hypothetical protein
LPFRYQSGEDVQKGDRVQFHDQPGYVEFVADPLVNDSETDWYAQEYGGGVKGNERKRFGSVFVSDSENAEDLVLVSRAAKDCSGAKS